MNTPARDIRGVLIQTEAARLLLPNATISEVLSYADPEPVDDAPHWLLGRIRWRGWRLPLVAFAPFAGLGAEHGGLGSKVVVLSKNAPLQSRMQKPVPVSARSSASGRQGVTLPNVAID